jgi:hypothetical protein
MSKDNVAFVLPPKLSKEVKKIQKELDLNSPGEVITKALFLLKVSLGRKVRFESKDNQLEIDEFQNYRETITFDDSNDG